jgi:Leucine-rich repeat (LRR) protein
VLQAPYNDISRITRFDETLTGIVDLNLSKNPIAAWSDILWLSSLLPNLKTLAINECLITNIEFPKEYTANTKDVGVERSVSWFPSLTMLQLSCCNIDNWASVEALNVISNLAHIKFKFNPILEKESQENGRQLTIAAIKSLTYLNGSKIEKQERRGAEIDFLKKYGLEYLSLKASQDSKEIDIFCNNHPR